MPPLTRDQGRQCFSRILREVLDQDDDTPLALSLEQEGINDIFSLVSMDKDTVEQLKFQPVGETNKKALPRGYKQLLITLFDYTLYSAQRGHPMQDQDWMLLSGADFDSFRISNDYMEWRNNGRQFPSANPPSPPPPSTPPVPTTPRYSPADMFKRGIKRDATAFPVLKDERYKDTWHRSFATQARAQDVENILDPNYVPNSPDANDLFKEQQKYMYAVLERCVLTDMGKSIVRKHELTGDAQKVYSELSEHHSKSTKARIDSSALLTYITSARLGTGEWKGTTEGFIVHWQEQIRRYEKQLEASEHFSESQKKVMLENAVHPIKELAQVKISADIDLTRTGKPLTYDQYVNLLLAAAASYDVEARKPRQVRRQVYLHEQNYEPDFGYSESDEYYNIDSPVTVIQAHAHDRRPMTRPPPRTPVVPARSVRMSRDQWHKLSDESKQLWDKLSDSDKAIILGLGTSPSPRRVNLHEVLDPDPDPGLAEEEPEEEFVDASEEPPDEHTRLINATKTGTQLPPGDIRWIMGDSGGRNPSSTQNLPTQASHTPNQSGRTTRSAHAHITYTANAHCTYRVSNHTRSTTHALVDRGANGGVAGNDVRVIARNPDTHMVNIQGIDNHTVNDIHVGTVGGVISTNKGSVIAIFHNYALFGKGYTIHAPLQMEDHGVTVCDKSRKVGGQQKATHPDGYVTPFQFKHGLPRWEIRPYTDSEWDTLPHVFFTTDHEFWDPSKVDDEGIEWFDAQQEEDTTDTTYPFTPMGDYRHRTLVQQAVSLVRSCHDPLDDTIDRCVFHAHTLHHRMSVNPDTYSDMYHDSYSRFYEIHETSVEGDDESVQSGDPPDKSRPPRTTSPQEPDYDALRPMFGWAPIDTIKKTLESTTQWARIPMGTLLKRAYKSLNPAANVHRRPEPVACDIVYSDTPAVDDGSKAAAVFIGLRSHVADAYGLKTDKQFVNTLEDNIRERGAMNKLVSDRAQVEIGERVLHFLRALCISSWQSEPHQQHQNPFERRWQAIKHAVNRVMDRTGCPAFCWLLCLQYVCYLYNHMWDESIKAVPLCLLLGFTVDTSVLLRFHFWQLVLYNKHEYGFPSASPEGLGRIVGISEHVGNSLTWKILTEDTKKIIHRSQVRPFSKKDPNFRLDKVDGEPSLDTPIQKLDTPIQKFIQSRFELAGSDEINLDQPESTIDHDPEDDTKGSMPIFDPTELIGKTFLLNPKEDGQRFRARIVQLIEDHESAFEDNPTRIKFLLSVNNDTAEEIISYNEMLDYIGREDENPVTWKFRRIVSHQGPLKPEHADYNGSTYNVLVEWENGEVTKEPLSIIGADDPVTCAVYAKEHGLLDKPGWKRFKGIAKRHKKFVRLVNQAKLRSYRTAPKYKYGYEVARDYSHAVKLDERNGNTRYQDAIDIELEQIDEYQTFINMGHKDKVAPPPGYKKIRVHIVFDVKHDGRHKARLVADGHLTDVPVESVYSGVVSLRGFRLVLCLAELNNLSVWATDVGNAYLEAKTSEKVYIIAGPEFGPHRVDHILIINKALYGLRSSGSRWHDRFADCLRELGFTPCKAEPDIWMRKDKTGKRYEYVATYVDDLTLALADPEEFVKTLQERYGFKLKGTGEISFHLGMDFYRENGVLCLAPKKYIEKLIDNYKRHFGEPPRRNVSSPIEQGDHPELDDSELLDEAGIFLYQSLIGSLQWVVSIGRFDVHTGVMTLSRFRAAPRKGHLERVKRVYGYLSKMRNAAIRIRMDEPDYSDLPIPEYDWARSVYGEIKELIPQDAPEPLGNWVTLTHFVDANLMHCMATGRSVTGILHLINRTPIDWFSKLQGTVETATYGSEFVAARTCIEQIIDLRTTLRYLGVPIRERSYMFGDNQSVVNSASQPNAKLHKRHTMLSFHRVREAIASAMVIFTHIPGEINPADILSKHWGYSQIWSQLRPLLFQYDAPSAE